MEKSIILFIIYLFINYLTADQTLQCGEWEAYKDVKCFKVFEKVLQTYDDAINTCYQNEASSLVSIQSLEEQEFLFYLLANVHKQVNGVWIGAHNKDRIFKWSDNTTVNYTNWANDNPINTSGYDCVQMSLTKPYNGQWLNEPCNQNYIVVCQKTQNWLFSYLQQTVMELRKSLDETKNEFQRNKETLQKTNDELIKTKSELQSTKIYLQNEIQNSIPPATIAYFANTTAPLGWLKANGQVLSRTTYANLFSIIGTTFGSGDGSTTFTLPDLHGEFIRGWSDGRDVDRERSFASFQWGSSIPYVTSIDNKWQVSSASGQYEHRGFAGKTFDGGFQAGISHDQTLNGMMFTGWANQIFSYYNDATSVGNISEWSVLQGTRPRNIALLACIKY